MRQQERIEATRGASASTLRHRVIYLTEQEVAEVDADEGAASSSSDAPQLQMRGGGGRGGGGGGGGRGGGGGGHGGSNDKMVAHARHIAASVVKHILTAGVEVITYVIEKV